MCHEIKGRAAIEALAKRFPQLYVAPADGAQAAHKAAASLGMAPEDAKLDHFIGSEDDVLYSVSTPAGPVDTLFLKNRADFETFLQIIGHKSMPVEIPRTIGAMTYRGIPDWDAIAAAQKDYQANGGDDWASEFKRLASIPGTFRADLVVVSEGPYSNVPADMTPYSETEWLRVSREIRLHHECAHVVCRRLMPENVLPVWDEITADVVGLLCATKKYDAHLAALFLGVTAEGYAEGRLSAYLSDDELGRIDDIATEIHAALARIESMCGDAESADPFGFLMKLKETPLVQL